jgi:hypothetical protein
MPWQDSVGTPFISGWEGDFKDTSDVVPRG